MEFVSGKVFPFMLMYRKVFYASCRRCLDKKLITLVLSFLGRGSGAYMTCKYWKVCLDEAIESQKALSSIPALMSAETIPAAEKEEVMTEEDVESAN